MKRRNLILLLGGTSSGALSIGTGAFSSAQAERGVNVNVADDDSALVGYDTPADQEDVEEPVPVENGERITLVEISNRFRNGTDIGVVLVEVGVDDEDALNDLEIRTVPSDQSGDEEETIEVDWLEYTTDEPTVTFSPAGYAEVTALVDDIGTDPLDVEVTIGVKGTGVSAQLFGDTRSFRIEGEEDGFTVNDISNVKFPGNSGNARIRTESNQGESGGENPKVDATAYYTHDGGVKSNSSEVGVNTQLKLDDDFDVSEGDSIVGISVSGIEGVFVHPKFDDESCEVKVGNSGEESGGGSNDNPGGGDGGDSGGEAEEAIGVDQAFGDCFDADED